MIFLAVCDDDTDNGQWIAEEAEKCMKQDKVVHEIYFFANEHSLLEEMERGVKIDIALLDIEMPEMGGMNLARQLKKKFPDMLIIFITFYEKYVYESFQVQPYRFIPKRCLRQMLPNALSDAVREIGDSREKYYLAENRNGLERIPLNRIIYIWHREKYAYIEMMDGTNAKVRKTLKQVYQELPPKDFVWVDKGLICNFARISGFKEGYVWFTNGAKVTVNRNRLTELKDKLRKYWCKGEEEN
ncbi:MAG: response regulator [Bacteroidales bacterium]|nr:response regulator [Lachnoclostridium sp.]MCM1385091.1 response regulator [Lachnoclostridium sp.]MCM1466058.1 response regulator [Bacteroidales bacterium]